jgi:hypothetical protein
MMEDAYTRIALRLRGLSAPDREWLLGQLDPEDCKRVSVALRQRRAQGASTEVLIEAGMPKSDSKPTAKPEAAASLDPLERLRSASLFRVKTLLAEVPDWAIALVLSAESWPWTQEFLGELSPERIRALRTLASELTRVKPKFRQAVVEAIAMKIEPAPAQSPVTLPFDAALERALSELPVIKSLRSDRV